MTEPKIVVFDIETSGLRADFSRMLSFGYLYYPSEKVKVISLLDTNPKCEGCGRVDATSDKELVKKVYPILAEADLLVSWYGREGNGFDAKFLNTRIIAAGLPALPHIPQIDLWVTSRTRLALTSNRLVNVQEFLKLHDKKTPLLKETWGRANAGDARAIKYVIDHNRADVLVLKEAYDILRPWVTNHPRVRGYGDMERPLCPVCGEGRMHIQKYRMTRAKGKMVQWQCKGCGAYDSRPERKGT